MEEDVNQKDEQEDSSSFGSDGSMKDYDYSNENSPEEKELDPVKIRPIIRESSLKKIASVFKSGSSQDKDPSFDSPPKSRKGS